MDCRPLDGIHGHCPRNVRIRGTSQGAVNGQGNQGGEGPPGLNLFQTLAILACVWALGIVGAFAIGGEDAPSPHVEIPSIATPPPVVTVECGQLWTADSGVWVKVCNTEEIEGW